MATKMLNFGGMITATDLGASNGSKIISKSGTSDVEFTLKSEREDGSTIIIFSMVLNNTSSENSSVDIWLVEDNEINKKVSVGKGITVVPGRPISLDYKINMTPNNTLYVVSDKPNTVEIVISAVQM